MNSNVVKVKLQNLEYVTETSEHWRFRCPFCPKHDPDVKGKLYIHKTKKIGICFRCETTVVEANGFPFRGNLGNDVNRKKTKPMLSIALFSKVRELERVRNYIEKRGIPLEICEKFPVLSAEGPDRVVFCNRIFEERKETDFLQFRYIDDQPDSRFFIPPGVQKELCWTHLIDRDVVMLCEGFFSGLSAYSHSSGSISPVVSIGKNLSNYQMKRLKEVDLSHRELVIFAEPDISSDHVVRLAHSIKYHCIVGKLSLIVSGSGDPNDLSKEQFMRLFNERVDLSNKTKYLEYFLSAKVDKYKVAASRIVASPISSTVQPVRA